MFKIKERREMFWSEDPGVNNRAEFPNRNFMIYLVYIYLDSSVGVGNRLREVRHGKRCSIFDKQQKPLLSSKGPDWQWESLNLIFKWNRGFSYRWWNRRVESLTTTFKLVRQLKKAWIYVSTHPHTFMILFLTKYK